MTKTRNSATKGTPKRSYSPKTLKVLFGLSRNQCAYPECSNPVIEPPTEQSDALVIAQICHIYAVSEKGPRGKPGLTQEALNAQENLILLCPNHHALVDGQHESYPADTLKEWKRDHETEMQKKLSPDLECVQPDILWHPYFPTTLVDQTIKDEVNKLRKSRFFMEFEKITSSLALGGRLVDRELSRGSDDVRSWGLAWCARLLSASEECDKAQEFLELSKTLGTVPEIDIAHAFIISQQGNRAASLQILGGIDTPSSRSAGLMVVTHHDGAERAIHWLKESDIKATDLDPDGKSYLLTQQLKLARWEAGLETLGTIATHDFDETPILHHLAGITKLSIAVPADLRAVVLNEVPFEALGFPLASDAVAMEARRDAHTYFRAAVEVAQRLECPRAAEIDDVYALWLELKDPAQSAHGKSRLEAKLRDPRSALAVVHLGVQFGINLDVGRVDRDIEREVARNGGMTTDAAHARFALAFTQKTPGEVADYLARHHDQLALHIDKDLLLFLQIGMLAQAGLPEKATGYLDQLIAEGIPDEQENRLRRMIAEAQGKDPVETRKQQFKATGSLSDLINLVNELETRRHWTQVCEYGKQLFDKTRSLPDAERLVNAFYQTHRFEALVEFLDANPDLLSQSKDLKMSYAWGLYNNGALLESRAALVDLSNDTESTNYRALQFHLALALGDLSSLSSFVANEFQQRDNRSAHDLMGAAQLGLPLGSLHAKDLVFAAAEKADDEAQILAGAYFLAMSAGWEDDPRTVQWLHRAAELSDEDGPLQRMSLKDVLDRKPEWDRRESETWRLLERGEIPIFLAAKSLNKSLIDLTIFPALANGAENDPRRRSAIPAYSGKRKPEQLSTCKTTTGIDATALFTLSFLNLLDKALDVFETVYIPHSTLGWLFEERQKAAFHQPSRIKNAHQIRDLLAKGALKKFVANTIPSSDLSDQVGDELATLIAEAERVTDDDAQRIVVCSAPVHRLSTLMEEEADLSLHATILSSCLAVIMKLRHKGQITVEEERRARAYLQLHEKPWPNQPKISDGAILYLDDLAITHLLQLGMLAKLEAAGLRAVASPRELSEVDALISYERISEQTIEVIERIRAALGPRIESGQVKVGPRRNFDEHEKETILEHPTLGLFALACRCDSAIADDRLVNQHLHIVDDGKQIPIFSTLDLLDALMSADVISEDERLEYRTRLRRAGYFFMPVSEEELIRYLRASVVEDGKVIETAELKAIRESVLRVRMSGWLQLPKEAPWLIDTLEAYIRVLRNLWTDGADIGEVTARSNWIANQVDVRGWAHSLDPGDGDNLVRIGRGAHILLLLTPPSDAQQSVIDSYWDWVEERILVPVKEQFPDLYDWLVECYKRQVSELVQTELPEGEAT